MVDAELMDPLLGIFNKRYLYETLPSLAARAQASGRSLAVVMADIDRLREIKETHGHDAGDAAFQHLVSLMRPSLRRADWMARCGAEEFVVVLPETHIDGAYAAAERMRRRCTEKPFALPDGLAILTASFGVACVDISTGREPDINAMLQDAKDAVRESKRAGRNRVTCGPARQVRARVFQISDV